MFGSNTPDHLCTGANVVTTGEPMTPRFSHFIHDKRAVRSATQHTTATDNKKTNEKFPLTNVVITIAIRLRHDRDPTIRRIARAYYHSTRAKTEHVNLSSHAVVS